MSTTDAPKTDVGDLNDDDPSFLSRILPDSHPQDEDDRDIDSLLNKGDDDYIPKTELDSNIEKLVEKLQFLDMEEALITEKAKKQSRITWRGKKNKIQAQKHPRKIEELNFSA